MFTLPLEIFSLISTYFVENHLQNNIFSSKLVNLYCVYLKLINCPTFKNLYLWINFSSAHTPVASSRFVLITYRSAKGHQPSWLVNSWLNVIHEGKYFFTSLLRICVKVLQEGHSYAHTSVIGYRIDSNKQVRSILTDF